MPTSFSGEDVSQRPYRLNSSKIDQETETELIQAAECTVRLASQTDVLAHSSFY